ncbi:hypothetical protein BDR05DRAFT_949750 [Suillus weaverae]|nr:hypothetical protein BDR05DRAFT_949750 [Suillus weaverae]
MVCKVYFKSKKTLNDNNDNLLHLRVYTDMLVEEYNHEMFWDEYEIVAQLVIAEEKANKAKPNYDKHQCFPPNIIVNGLRLYLNLNWVCKWHVNCQLEQCFIAGAGRDGSPQSSLLQVAETYGSDDEYDNQEVEELLMSSEESEDGPDK